MMHVFKKYVSLLIVACSIATPIFSYAEPTVTMDGQSLRPKAELFILPRSGDFLVGSTFEVPIYINTQNNNINAISLKLQFDSKKLTIVKPSGGKSIFGIWVEPPSYDNTKGVASLVGVIPGGIVTSSGLIATVTFKALAEGGARVSITDYSSVNLNDGLGSEVVLARNGALYTLIPKAPEGVIISSDTHPFQDRWYNNTSPIFRWEAPQHADGYSTLVDTNPTTIPPAVITTNDSQTAHENLKDGVWYFHVRASVKSMWGNTSHFQLKIDTKPPATFTPSVSTIKDSSGIEKYLISFLTTDTLSGIDHYEVGSIDTSTGAIESPVFIETDSPYLVPATTAHSMKVIVRAFDTALNMRETSVDLYPGFTFAESVKKYTSYFLIALIVALILGFILHYLFGHHIIAHMRKAYVLFKNISLSEKRSEHSSDNLEDLPRTGVTSVPTPPYIVSENEDSHGLPQASPATLKEGIENDQKPL
jgi:hypothetical protein